MYSVVLMMALTTGGDATVGRHHGGGCCGQSSSCGCEGGGRHHGHRHHGGGCGEVASCGCSGASYGSSSCGSCGASSGCSSCGQAYAPAGCSSCANGACSYVQPQAGAAVIVVFLPADAKLTVDGEATTSTSDHRVFLSPSLPTGQAYHYTLTAEVEVDGRTVAVSKTVSVRAGEESRITLTPPTGVAAR
ncbi:MAG TPA: hypothetical protein DDY78_27605 [Planctomycetales bacterium]|nr:hypothetical protein [Planctomycetales bacterium]